MNNQIGFQSLVRRELKRTFSIINQVIWPPIVSTLLYVVIIGLSLGSRIQNTSGVPYLTFLIPGLVALTVIESSYGESSASLFQHRFMGSIQELLTAPLSYLELVGGFVVGSLVRAYLLGNLLMLFLPVFAHRWPAHWVLYFVIMALISVLFSCVGLIMGLVAEKWDEIAIPQTFIFMPLIWIGGTFSPLTLLPPLIQPIARVNPIFYLVDAFRYALLGISETPIWLSLPVTVLLTAAAAGIVLALFRRGYKLRA